MHILKTLYLSSWLKGMKYEGVEDTVLTGSEDESHQRKYWGPSSFHSTAIHSLDAFLGVGHSKGK